MKISDFKCYVINLDRRPDRMEEFRERFAPLGLPEIERVAAVDGTETPAPADFRVRGMPGAWGCFQSHVRLIRRAYDAENLEAGVWNVQPPVDGDHMFLQGGLTKKHSVFAFYRCLLEQIERSYTKH